MIRIARGTEPGALPGIRAAALALLAPNGPANRRALPATYKSVHGALWDAQFQKCAYCEHREQSKRNDVDHFRPAMRADRAPGSAATYGYWWLAYTWDNLLFACRNCNQSPNKLDKFPLDVGSVALVPQQPPPGQEMPLLIDPATEHGTVHIQFVSTTRAGGGTRWMPRPRNGSVRGQQTIRVCGLDRPDLLTLYECHVKENLEPDLVRLQGVVATGDTPTIQREWAGFITRHLAPSSIFAGLSLDVLDATVSRLDRATHGLVLPVL